MPLYPDFPLAASDYTVGTISLTAGSKDFTLTGSNPLDYAAAQAGDEIYVSHAAKTLLIETITNTGGTLIYPCPADCAGTDLPFRLQLKNSASRLQGMAATLLQAIGSGNLAGLDELTIQDGQLIAGDAIEGKLKAVNVVDLEAIGLTTVGALALKDKAGVGDIEASGTPSQDSVLHGDGVWREASGGGQGSQGPKGDKGDKGDKGEKGDTGPAGPPGSGGGAGSGDMAKSVYDPTGKNADAFNMDNMGNGTINKLFTDQEKAKLAGFQAASSYMLKGYKLTAGAGLSGGGTLGSADITLSLNAASLAFLALADTAVQPNQLGTLAGKNEVGVADIEATGTADSASFLRGDGVWAQPAGGSGGGKAYANLIINGDFRVDQRGNNGSMTGGLYGYDRWLSGPSRRVQVVERLSAGTYALYWDGGSTGRIGTGDWGASPRLITLNAAGNVACTIPSVAMNICLIKVASINEYPSTNPFYPRPFAEELALCQRYYQKSSPYGVKAQENTGHGIRLPTTLWTSNDVAPSGKVSAYLYFPTRMAKAPVMSYYDNNLGAPGGVRGLDGEGDAFGFLSVEKVYSSETYAVLANMTSAPGEARYFLFNYEANAEISA